jgi:hypothetical protein
MGLGVLLCFALLIIFPIGCAVFSENDGELIGLAITGLTIWCACVMPNRLFHTGYAEQLLKDVTEYDQEVNCDRNTWSDLLRTWDCTVDWIDSTGEPGRKQLTVRLYNDNWEVIGLDPAVVREQEEKQRLREISRTEERLRSDSIYLDSLKKAVNR